MSWLRTAVSKAVEVKNYADSVVQQAGQAVAEGAKLFQDRIVKFLHFLFFSFKFISFCKRSTLFLDSSFDFAVIVHSFEHCAL